MEYILLILGFVLIIKASDILVDAASSLAIKWKIPKIAIALIIMAFGTCAPEFAISMNSISINNGNIALANVIGSCIVNVLLIIGIASVVKPIRVKKQTINKELPILLFCTFIFELIIITKLYFFKTKILTRLDGLILCLSFLVFMFYIIKLIRKNDTKNSSDINAKYGMIKSLIYLVLSIIVIGYSSDLIVDNAVLIANNFNISEKVISLVIIAIGTSLPELVMTVSASKKKEFDIAVGNIIGTNIFNICIVLGLPILIYGNLNIVGFDFIDIAFFCMSSLIFFIFARSDRKINFIEGLIMITLFLLYYGYILFI